MPRKKIKTEKQPLLFLERPAGSARVHHNVPEVRAAVNPKEFFTETQGGHNGSTLNAWVSPQFDASAAAALPVRRGRRKCKSSTSIQGNFSQFSKKSSVSGFPTLLFETKSREQTRHLKHTQRKDDISVSPASNHQQGISQRNSTICNVQKCGTVTKDSSSQNNNRSSKNKCKRSSVEDHSSPAFKDCTNSDTGPQLPDVVTPKVTQEYSTSSHALNLLRSPPCNPSYSGILDILVPDTPERDYGIKVTWRRRRGLMLLLKEKGHLSDTDTVIHI